MQIATPQKVALLFRYFEQKQRRRCSDKPSSVGLTPKIDIVQPERP